MLVYQRVNPTKMGVTGGQLPPFSPHHAMLLLPGRAGSAVTKSESGSARLSRRHLEISTAMLWAPGSGWYPKIAGIYGWFPQ